MQRLKCVLVGDDDAEKTQLLNSYTCTSAKVREFSRPGAGVCLWQTTVDFKVMVAPGADTLCLELIDTSGLDNLHRLLCYTVADVFLICFSVTSPSSNENIGQKWVPEITHYCPDVPFLLVGTRAELRADCSVLKKLSEDKQRPLEPKDGQRLAQELKAVKYLECSAETKDGLKEVFEEVASVALVRAQSKKSCILL